MIQTKYFCPKCSEGIDTTDANFATDKLWVKRAVAFMETHKNHSQTIKTNLDIFYAQKEISRNTKS